MHVDEQTTYALREKMRLETRARRTARTVGLAARKTRWHAGSLDNCGGFSLFDPHSNRVIAGEKFDLTPEQVIMLCTERKAN